MNKICYRVAHHATVKKLAFRPLSDDTSSSKQLYLASCGSDFAVRLYSIDISSV